MKARDLLRQQSFDPSRLQAVGQAFDEAWSLVAGSYASPSAIVAARLKLANSVLAVAAADHNADVEAIKQAALKHFAST